MAALISAVLFIFLMGTSRSSATAGMRGRGGSTTGSAVAGPWRGPPCSRLAASRAGVLRQDHAADRREGAVSPQDISV